MFKPVINIHTSVYSLPMTLMLSTLVLLVFFVGQIVGIMLFAPNILPDGHLLDTASQIAMGSEHGTVISLSVAFTCALLLITVCLLIYLKKDSKITDYLALKGFSWQHLLLGIGLLIVFNIILEIVFRWFWIEPLLFVDELYATAQPLWLLIVAMVVLAPIYEEVVFRGFMWIGIANSRLGFWGASMITSLVFAIIHLQYGIIEMSAIVVLAMLFSYIRAVSGSLLLVILLHIVNNAVAMGQYLLI